MEKEQLCALDTSYILDFEDVFSQLKNICIPLTVLEELDGHKNSEHPQNSFRARKFIKQMMNIVERNEKETIGGWRVIYKNVNGEKLIFLTDPSPSDSRNDKKILNSILDSMSFLQEYEVILYTNDSTMFVEASLSNIQVKSSIVKSTKINQNFPSVVTIAIENENLEELYRNKTTPHSQDNLIENQSLVVHSDMDEKKSALGIYQKDRKQIQLVENYTKKLHSSKNSLYYNWITPKNKEQTLCFHYLFDKDIKLVTLAGRSGTGKTLCALSTGLYQVLEEGKYDKLIIARPIVPMGRDLGFLPGSLQDKLDPWIQPIKDNLLHIMGQKEEVEVCLENEIIEIEALTYLRGRSMPRIFMIVDEIQNLSPHEIKTIVTRMGEGSKLVLTGDIEQIDNKLLNEQTNGLSYLIDKFRGQKTHGHVTLTKGERSELATLASKLL